MRGFFATTFSKFGFKILNKKNLETLGTKFAWTGQAVENQQRWKGMGLEWSSSFCNAVQP